MSFMRPIFATSCHSYIPVPLVHYQFFCIPNFRKFCEPLSTFSLMLEIGNSPLIVKFMFSKEATKIEENFAVYLIDGEDFVRFCGLLRRHRVLI